MIQYRDLVARILHTGHDRGDRTGTGTRSIFGHQMRFDLSEGFPIVTSKRTAFHAAKIELLWMLKGDTNLDYLHKHNVHIWDEWADEDGNLGPIYGAQWRFWEGHQDQIVNLIRSLRDDPLSRRHIVSAWNASDLPDAELRPDEQAAEDRMALAPCHTLFQFYVQERDGKRYLSCQLYQRSADVFLGVPFNIVGYSLLTHMLAHYLGYEVGEFIWSGGDCHLYLNHLDQVNEMMERSVLPLPTLKLTYPSDTPIWNADPELIQLEGYNHHPAIKATVAV